MDDEVVGDVVYFRAHGIGRGRLVVRDCQGHAWGQSKTSWNRRGRALNRALDVQSRRRHTTDHVALSAHAVRLERHRTVAVLHLKPPKLLSVLEEIYR